MLCFFRVSGLAPWCSRMYTNGIKSLILTLKRLIYLNVTCGKNLGNNFLKQLVLYNSKNKGTAARTLCKCVAFQNYTALRKHGQVPHREWHKKFENVLLLYIHSNSIIILNFNLINIIHLTHKTNLKENSFVNIDMNISK